MTKASARKFPPFPDDLAHAPIAVVSSRKLLTGDETTGNDIFEACRTYGFFYLDLRDSPEGLAILANVDELYDLSEDVFALPLVEKEPYSTKGTGSSFGYKPAGTVKLTDKDRRQDSTEFFNVGKDHILGFSEPNACPNIIEEYKIPLQRFIKGAHQSAIVILQVLARQLGLPEDAFSNLNRIEEPAGSHVRLTSKSPQPHNAQAIGLASHTDFGSVTVLFNWLGGLQIESRTPGRVGEWEYVRPMPGHAIINLGDAMVKFTNGALKSAKHRVASAPGEQNDHRRISIVYFMRPADNTLMKPLDKFQSDEAVLVGGKLNADGNDDRVYTASEWLFKRTVQLQS